MSSTGRKNLAPLEPFDCGRGRPDLDVHAPRQRSGRRGVHGRNPQNDGARNSFAARLGSSPGDWIAPCLMGSTAETPGNLSESSTWSDGSASHPATIHRISTTGRLFRRLINSTGSSELQQTTLFSAPPFRFHQMVLARNLGPKGPHPGEIAWQPSPSIQRFLRQTPWPLRRGRCPRHNRGQEGRRDGQIAE